MTRPNILLALAILGTGVAIGHAIKKSRVSSSPRAAETHSSSSNQSITQSPNSPSPTPWQIHGNLSLPDLITYPPGPRRMAEVVMWLPRATPEELRQFWQHVTTSTPLDYKLLPLLMDRWMALAPEDAIAATAGTKYEGMPWTAWGKVNPELAVQEAKRRNCGYLWRVLEGAALAHPEFTRRLLEQNPGMVDITLLHQLGKGLESDSWQAALDHRFHWQKLANWARDEPEKALEWALENSSSVRGYNAWSGVVGPMLEADPAKLDAAIAKLPEGRSKSEILVEKAKALAITDPAAALAMLDAAEAGAPRRRLLEVIGPALLESNPGRSLQIFRELAEAGMEEITVSLPGGDLKNDLNWLGLHEEDWIIPLLKHDPTAVIKGLPERMANEIMSDWQRYDIQGYSSWLVEQPRDFWTNHRCYLLAMSFASGNGGSFQGSYPTAFEWVARISDERDRDRHGEQLVGQWLKENPAEAEAYFRREDALQKPAFEKLKQAAQP